MRATAEYAASLPGFVPAGMIRMGNKMMRGFVLKAVLLIAALAGAPAVFVRSSATRTWPLSAPSNRPGR